MTNASRWLAPYADLAHQELTDAEEAVRLSPNDPNALANRGMAYLFLQQYDAAVADYLKQANAKPANPEKRMMCAAIYGKLGRVDDYRRQRKLAAKYRPALKVAPDFELPTPLPPLKKGPE